MDQDSQAWAEAQRAWAMKDMLDAPSSGHSDEDEEDQGHQGHTQEDQERQDLLPPAAAAPEASPPPPLPRPTVSQMCLIRTYVANFCCHAVCCEGPCACCEGACKGAAYGVAGAGLACARQPGFGGVLREACLFLAASLSLAVPCCALCVYRGFSVEEDWDLAPIPTCLGMVDPRRFYCFAQGQGVEALNNQEDALAACVESESESMDTLPGTVLHHPVPRCMRRWARQGVQAAGVEMARLG